MHFYKVGTYFSSLHPINIEALCLNIWRYLRFGFDNRFEKDMGLLFCLANTRMRHEVNQAVSAKVHSSGRAFEQFKEAINDEDFEDLLKDAQADPKGVAAQDLLKKVLPFLSTSTRQLFWKRIQIAAHG